MNPAMNTQDILVKIQCLWAGAEKKKKKAILQEMAPLTR